MEYQVCEGEAFGLSPTLTTGMQDDDCVSSDYVGIPTSATSCNPTGAASAATDSRYCGPFLNVADAATQDVPICGECARSECGALQFSTGLRHDFPSSSADCTAPFTVEIYTDGFADGQIATGFSNTVVQSQGEKIAVLVKEKEKN